MKKLLLSLCAVLLMLPARADEGMWIPMLIGKNYQEMVRMGLKLSKEDLYSINNASLKDAVVQFGGGCTGEIISPSGLLLTNHHCGYGYIAGLSTVQDNYLDNGFWAHSMQEELPAPGLSVIFLQRMEDVTDRVLNAVGNSTGEKFNEKLKKIAEEIEKEAAQDGKYVADVKAFFNGNQYILMTYKKYTDVRLVATPPKSLGKFGGDTDNWMWPRHTADFSMFRVYAGKDNEPAEYSKDNVPYKPKKHLKVSIGGVKDGDFAMIFGYPGRTNRYETSYGIESSLDIYNPSIVKIRDKRLDVMRHHMDQDKEVYLKLTSLYSRISNYWKYYIGQTEQLKRLKVYEAKQQQERDFVRWANKSGNDDYANVLNEYSKVYSDYKPYMKHVIYYYEAFRASSLTRLAGMFEPLYKELSEKNPDQKKIDAQIKNIKAARAAMMKEFDRYMEEDLFAEMTELFYEDVPKAQHPDIYQTIFQRFGGESLDNTMDQYASYVFKNTFLLNDETFEEFTKAPNLTRITSDPAIKYALSFVNNFEQHYQPKYEAYGNSKTELNRTYMRGLMEMNKGKLFYPDANSTMRISYGKVKAYSPEDAVVYEYYTTLEGLMEKYKPGDDEFDVPKELIDLYKSKNYGRYANEKGELVTCFITTNDITGGNSGSPVLNARGELIGCAFDGNWEAMSGDIAFDDTYKRTICVDARYILFLIEKMGKAHNLIEEMEIRK